MNEFLEQFLIEARDLLGQAGTDLMALEQAPQDRARLDSLFRAFHTLKGAAGIVDFDAMGLLMHAVEDSLAAARSDGPAVAKHLIDRSFDCLDLLERWLSQIEVTEALPADAEPAARALMANLPLDKGSVPKPAEPSQLGSGAAEPSASWLEVFDGQPLGDATVAVRYIPDPESFFRGEDPLLVISKVPGLRGLIVKPRGPWPEIEELDPFECTSILYALSASSPEEVSEYLAPLGERAESKVLSETAQASHPDQSTALFRAQLALLSEAETMGRIGRWASSGRVVGNVLRYMGHIEKAQEIEAATDEARQTDRPDRLVHLLSALAENTLPLVGAAAPTDAAADIHVEAASSLRVDVKRIDAIVKLTGEITVVKNAIGHLAARAASQSVSADFVKSLQEQNALLQRLTDELQRSVVAVRVLPLRHVFQRFPRLVRDIASRLGKVVSMTTEGDGTEADKVVVEGLFEPLLHILRNAVDHGVEASEERSAAGKPAMASIRLRGYRQAEHVIVEVSDDGRGIDLDAIKRVALARNLITDAALLGMTNEDVIDLIFLPGFSAAKTVTELSGRGVGMDAVRTAVGQLGGVVGVETRRGAGTTVRITVPFSVMMTRIMTLEAGGQVFGLPFEAIVEMARFPREAIIPVGAARAIVFREQTIPLISLPAVLGQGQVSEVPPAPANIVVARVGTQLGALEVDRFGGSLDAMLSAKSGLLAGMQGVAGTTLMGDGRVLIVLDLQELLQ